MYYDSMIAKLIVHGEDRAEAIQRMREGLNAFYIRGVSSSIPFQAALMQHPRFAAAISTPASSRGIPQGLHRRGSAHEDFGFLAAVAAFARRKYIDRAVQISNQARGLGPRSVRTGRCSSATTSSPQADHRPRRHLDQLSRRDGRPQLPARLQLAFRRPAFYRHLQRPTDLPADRADRPRLPHRPQRGDLQRPR